MILLDGSRLAIQRRRALAKGVILPMIVLVGVDALSLAALPRLIGWLVSLVHIAAYTLFALSVHRVILLGPDAIPEWGVNRWRFRETYFALHVLALSIIYFISLNVLVIAKSPWIALLVSSLVAFYLLARFSLLFPGAAVDHFLTFRQSWQLTKNHQWLMLCVVIIIPVLIGSPMLVTTLLIAGGLPQQLHGFFPLIIVTNSIIGSLLLVVAVSFLSVAYAQICGADRARLWR